MRRALQKAERRSSQTSSYWTEDGERLLRLGTVSSQMPLKQDDGEYCLPEPWAASLDMERVTRIFSVRTREVVVTESIAKSCKSAK
jgi:hypothetical protein